MTDHRPDIEHRLAEALRAPLPPDVAARHEALLRARAAELGSPVVVPLRRRRLRRLVVVGLAAALALAVPTAAFADDAVPGDLLYPVDRALERLELTLASEDADVHLRHAAERVSEAIRLAELGDVQDVASLVDEAVAAGGRAVDADATAAAAVARHLDRLAALRDRLEADGHASDRAVEAIDRATGRSSRAQPGGGTEPDPTREPGPPAHAPAPSHAPGPPSGASNTGEPGGPANPPEPAAPPATGQGGPPEDPGSQGRGRGPRP